MRKRELYKRSTDAIRLLFCFVFTDSIKLCWLFGRAAYSQAAGTLHHQFRHLSSLLCIAHDSFNAMAIQSVLPFCCCFFFVESGSWCLINAVMI